MSIVLPANFVNRIHTQFGNDASEFINGLNCEVPVSVRINKLKSCQSGWDEMEKVPWCNEGRYLPEKPVFTLDPLFHAGCYYAQEASSMVIHWLLENVCKLPERPVILDLCGAPGGKSTLLASYLMGEGLLVANEVIKNRVGILAENLIKWGAANKIVTFNDPSAFTSLYSFFDLILVDAPCSGEGMFRKADRSVEEWSLNNARMCASRQRRILSDAWPAIKEGGFLIYSTCTYNPDENEENIKWFAQNNRAEVISIETPENWGIESIPILAGNGLAFYPHKVKGEGFFVSVLKKTESVKPIDHFKFEKKQKKLNIPGNLRAVIESGKNWSFYEEKIGYRAFSGEFNNVLKVLQPKLNLIHYGVLLGARIKNIFIPAHELAMSTELKSNAFQKIEVSKQTALRYLKGETIMPAMDLPKGYILVTYQNIILGFAKNIGNRMNNLYPPAWRIKMSLPG